MRARLTEWDGKQNSGFLTGPCPVRNDKGEEFRGGLDAGLEAEIRNDRNG
jgi:hypothetical protein